MSSDHTISALIGRNFNGYRVTRYIARGGMGMVFEGVQESLSRPVAIKLLYPHLSGDERFRERFEREARAIAQLTHPNIVRVLDYGGEDTYYFMVLDFIDGPSLRDHLQSLHAQGQRLAPGRALEILRQVSSALSYAHGLGFIHRDVKPGNIMLGKDGRAFLTDFGVVKLLGSEQVTVTGTFLGTPEYMSPEQATGGEIGPTSDLYALAIVAYEMLVGQVPFKASTPIQVMQKQLNDPPPMPSPLAPMYGAEIDTIFGRALAKNAGARYRSTNEFVEDLARVVGSSSAASGAGISTLLVNPAAPGHNDTPVTPASGTYQDASVPPPVSSGGVPPGYPPASYPASSTNQSYAAVPPSYADASPVYAAGGAAPPPGPPVAGLPPESSANPPERRRGAAIVGGVLALLLLAALAGYFLFMNDDDEDDGTVGAGSTATATSEMVATIASAESTATSAPEVATATVVVVAEDTPTIEAATATATATPLPEMVIYYAFKPEEAHNPQIYVMKLDGTDPRLFVEARGHSWGPVTSLDGSRLMFSSVTREDHTIHTADGGGLVGSGNHDIYALDVVGTDFASLGPANLDNVSDEYTSWDNGWSWTIDGEWITFTSDRPAEDGSTDWEIYLMRPDGTEIDQLTDTPYNEGWPVWTPDGTQIVYSSNETGNDEIYIMDADGTNPRQLTYLEDSNELFPSVSPDGTRIIFSSQIPAVNEGTLWIMDIDGGNLRQLTSTAALNNIPSWCPAGDLVVFVSDVRGNDNIFIMNADGTGLKPLTDDPGEDTTPHCALLPTGGP